MDVAPSIETFNIPLKTVAVRLFWIYPKRFTVREGRMLKPL